MCGFFPVPAESWHPKGPKKTKTKNKNIKKFSNMIIKKNDIAQNTREKIKNKVYPKNIPNKYLESGPENIVQQQKRMPDTVPMFDFLCH